MSDKNKSTNAVHINRPNNIIIDIYGVIASKDYYQEYEQYLRHNVSDCLNNNFTNKRIVDVINKLREQALIDRSAGHDIPLIEESNKPKDVVLKSLETNILWQMDDKHNTSQYQLNFLYQMVVNEGYSKSQLKTHAFSDVKNALNHWRAHQFVKIYSYALGAPEAQKQFLRASKEGDLAQYMNNHLNYYSHNSQDFRVIVSQLRETDPQNLLYFTEDPIRAKAAIGAGLRAVVVLRPGNKQYFHQELEGLQTITSLDEIVLDEVAGQPAPCC